MPTKSSRTADEPQLAPRALRYAETANAAEQLIVDALPEIIAKLVSMAKDGDVRASRYLVDRIYGRVARRAAPPIDDQAIPYTHRDWGRAKFNEQKKHEDFIRGVLKPVAQPFDDLFPSRIPGISRITDGVDPLIEVIRKERARQTKSSPEQSRTGK